MITILSKLKKEEYLKRDHKIILILLWEQYYNPTDKLTLTPSELSSIGLYGVRSIHNTLRDLVSLELVSTIKGSYEITPKFLLLLLKNDNK